MYDEIINSKKLSQSAAVFLSLPPRSYSIKEASGLLRVSPGTASYILNKLAVNGLLRNFNKHGKKFFFFNVKTEIPVWAKNRFLKYKKKIDDRLCGDIKKLCVKAAFLSGVFTGYANLPVDILLVGRIDLKKLDRLLSKWQRIMGMELNYSIMSEREFLSRRDTFDKFIKDIFDHRHVAVVDRVGKR